MSAIGNEFNNEFHDDYNNQYDHYDDFNDFINGFEIDSSISTFNDETVNEEGFCNIESERDYYETILEADVDKSNIRFINYSCLKNVTRNSYDHIFSYDFALKRNQKDDNKKSQSKSKSKSNNNVRKQVKILKGNWKNISVRGQSTMIPVVIKKMDTLNAFDQYKKTLTKRDLEIRENVSTAMSSHRHT